MHFIWKLDSSKIVNYTKSVLHRQICMVKKTVILIFYQVDIKTCLVDIIAYNKYVMYIILPLLYKLHMKIK